MGVNTIKRDVVDATIVGSARGVLLAIAGGDDIVLAAKAAIAAAAAPGSRVLVVHLQLVGRYAEAGQQMQANLAQAIALIEEAGIPASGVVARPDGGVNVIANIAREWLADVTLMGSSRRGDLVTMVLGTPS